MTARKKEKVQFFVLFCGGIGLQRKKKVEKMERIVEIPEIVVSCVCAPGNVSSSMN